MKKISDKEAKVDLKIRKNIKELKEIRDRDYEKKSV